MRINEIVRKNAFWFLDFIKGRKIRKHYHEIFLILEHGFTDEAIQRQKNNLKNILNHAVATTQFYKPYRNYSSLQDFPVINKTLVRNNFKSLISNKFEESKLKIEVTSGSTGTPLKVYHDKTKILRNSADTIYFYKISGYKIGYKLLYLRSWSGQHSISPLNSWIRNIIPIDVSKLNDEYIKNLVNRIEKKKYTYAILGYASSLELICKYLERNNYGRVKAKVKSVIAMSESLSDFTRESIKKYFNSPVFSRYSNLENGIIAQQNSTESGKYLINTASYIVEILKMDSDDKAEPGKLGRIVITDLFNYGMPLIRYDTNDVGVLSTDDVTPGNMFLAKVEGRKGDMLFDSEQNFVSSLRIVCIMRKYKSIIQYQLIQEDLKKYLMNICIEGEFSEETSLMSDLNECLGNDIDIKIERVPEIPLLASGKRKLVVNKYLQKVNNG